ncbi:hypothetical protein NWF24_26460 [Variovorax paradoxus]|uniref:hypothetical protein n=1 Tax=Variovorax paradoxus TaxID=34073 RepID=UPI0021ACA67A|nr:hypothetical protein [Variovorax paradoxus]UVH56358.1 hypothetical protein NWF24_26460 [Variovorax paradoxus]
MEQFNTSPEEVEFRIETGVAASRDFLVVSCSKYEERFDSFARICIFDADKNVQWQYFDLPLTIRAGALYRSSSMAAASIVLASEDGDIVHLPIGKAPELERVAGAGLWADDSEGWGYLIALRQIGERLYACGIGGQIYARDEDGTWQHVDRGLLQEREGTHNIFLNAVDGENKDAIYAVGWDLRTNAGLLYFRKGDVWQKLATESEELSGLCIGDSASVWVCGKNGTLLLGNQANGFSDLSSIAGSRSYSDVKVYKGRVYLAASDGLYVREKSMIEPVRTGLVPESRGCHVLQVVDDVLWSIGYADIARFDGTVWERIPFPGNPPIR